VATVFAEGGTPGREEQMSALVQKKLRIMESKRWRVQLGNKSIEVREQIDKAVRIVLFVRDSVSSTVSADPHAALAWAGVCVLLPVGCHVLSLCTFVLFPSFDRFVFSNGIFSKIVDASPFIASCSTHGYQRSCF
jgi:hypothetical protein